MSRPILKALALHNCPHLLLLVYQDALDVFAAPTPRLSRILPCNDAVKYI